MNIYYSRPKPGRAMKAWDFAVRVIGESPEFLYFKPNSFLKYSKIKREKKNGHWHAKFKDCIKHKSLTVIGNVLIIHPCEIK